MPPDDIWIFGYGSIVWKPDFPYAERAPGWVGGWSRRLWQGSPDHRGVPSSPGRVVTLVERAGARCLGVAFRVRGADREVVMSELDAREASLEERLAELARGGGALRRVLAALSGQLVGRRSFEH